MLAAETGEKFRRIVADRREAQALIPKFLDPVLQLDELRLAIRSPVGRTDEDDHGTLWPHDGLECPFASGLILQIEIGYAMTDLRTKLLHVNHNSLRLL